ncbi:septum formation initiator family protein [Tepidibacter aestuarii]|uniref:septum formation initiator family protein n=1 Tax=Tepidibacter aestuarii TaxID=2925782 RepID=UPI0020BE33BC|nr:cell division protein FtsL [Tepidibacter aestuarii]CAH2212740.1 Cell division protein FtsL [Tepidibacter aestuarii]
MDKKETINLNDYKKKKKKQLKKKTQLNNINKPKNKKSRNKRKTLVYIVFVGIVLSIVITFMYRYSVISGLKYDMESLKKELGNKKNEKKQLDLKLEELNRSGFIEKEAIERLNMNYPTEEQTVYINID